MTFEKGIQFTKITIMMMAFLIMLYFGGRIIKLLEMILIKL